jgi:hypothetical protein
MNESKYFVILAPCLITLFIVVNLLQHHGYDLFRWEVLLFAGCMIAVGAVLGRLQLIHLALKLLLSALLLTLFVTMQFDLSLSTMVGFFCAFILVGYLLKSRFEEILSVFFAVMLVSGMVLNESGFEENAAVRAGNPDLPLYLHLVLDGHQGIAGLPDDIAGGPELREELERFFLERGFFTYPQAYSHYVSTANSLHNLFNFDTENFNYFNADSGVDTTLHTLQAPEYFRRLYQQGYALRVMHPQYIDYCSANTDWVSGCFAYANLNLKSIEMADMPASRKASLMAQVLVKQSSVLTGVYQRAQSLLSLSELEVDLLPGTDQSHIDRLIQDIEQHPNGAAYIVHLLTPHVPFVRTANCDYESSRSLAEASARDEEIEATVVENTVVVTRFLNTDKTREQRYQNYFETVRCSFYWLGQIFDALEAQGIYDRAVVVIHSDHGSGISKLVPVTSWQQQLTRADYIDSFSALFVVKAPIRPAENTFIPLEEALYDLVVQLYGKEKHLPSLPPFVFLRAGDGSSLLQPKQLQSYIYPR